MDLSRPRPRWQMAAIAAVTAVVSAVLVAYLANLPPARPAPPVAATRYTWPHGTPAGITLSELQDYEVSAQLITMMKKQIRAAADYWHANTVRFQILQDRLVGAEGRRFNRPYMDAIRAVTDYALRLGLTVVLNAQTEVSMGYALDEPLPTHATQVFWQRMMDRWADNPHVVFDLFNEPRRCTWAQWRAAFQRLIDYVRGHHASNQYFRYLTAQHIGMLAWSLVPGALNSNSAFTSTSREPQGDGQLVRAWLAATAAATQAAGTSPAAAR